MAKAQTSHTMSWMKKVGRHLCFFLLQKHLHHLKSSDPLSLDLITASASFFEENSNIHECLHRARKPDHQPPQQRNHNQRPIHIDLHGGAAGRDPPIPPLPVHIGQEIHHAGVRPEHHVAALHRLHHVHDSA